MVNKNVNIEMDTDLWQQAKVEAVKQRKTLRVFVTEALVEKLNEGKKGDNDAKRQMP